MATSKETMRLPEPSADCAPLFDFCRAHKRIFLYGAGDYAGRYTLLLNSGNISVEAYIVTDEQHKAEYLGRPVYSATEARKLLRVGDGVVPAFEDCTVLLVREKLGLGAEDVLALDHGVIDRALIPAVFQCLLADCVCNPPERCETLPRKGIESILIVRMDLIGDMICTTAFLRELRRNYPDASITLLCDQMNEPLLRNCPYINRTITCKSTTGKCGLVGACGDRESIYREAKRVVSETLRNECFDLAFFPRGVFFDSFLVRDVFLACELKARYKIIQCLNTKTEPDAAWKEKAFAPYFSKIVPISEEIRVSEGMLVLLRGCGLRVENERTELWPTEAETARARELLACTGMERERLVAVGLKGSLPVRCWDRENFRKLFELLGAAYGERLGIVILGGGDAAEDAAELARADGVVSFAGKLALNESAAMMGLCGLYIGPSTSLLHMATALRVPSVTLYHVLDEPSVSDKQPESPTIWRPDDDLPHVSLLPRPGLDGCRGYCRKPYAHCINLITPERVFAAAKRILEQ